MPIRLHMAPGSGPDILMILTDDNAYNTEIQKDEKGEFIILPPEIKPKRKNRKVYLESSKESKETTEEKP